MFIVEKIDGYLLAKLLAQPLSSSSVRSAAN